MVVKVDTILENLEASGFLTASACSTTNERMTKLIADGLVARSPPGRVKSTWCAEYCITMKGREKLALGRKRRRYLNELRLDIMSTALVVGNAHNAQDFDLVRSSTEKLAELATAFNEAYKGKTT